MKKSIFEKYPITFQIIISSLILIVFDHIAGWTLIPYSYSSFRTVHYAFHHGLIPNQNTQTIWGVNIYPFCTNSMGLRDALPRKLDKTNNKNRILILGDSHSEGVGIRYEQTFSGKLSQLLGSDFEVINGSAISYSPHIEYLKAKYLIEYKGLKVNEIIVPIDISDLQNELVYENYQPKNPSIIADVWLSSGNYLKRHSFVYYTLKNIQENKERDKFFATAALFDSSRLQGTANNTSELYATFFKGFNDNVLLSNPQFHGVGEWIYDSAFIDLAKKGILLAQNNLRLLNKLCINHNIKLTISVHPWHPQIGKGDTTNFYTESYREFAKKEGIGFINLFPLFINHHNPVFTIEKYYIHGDNHWNINGHALIAKEFEKHIRNHEIKL